MTVTGTEAKRNGALLHILVNGSGRHKKTHSYTEKDLCEALHKLISANSNSMLPFLF